MSRTEYMRNYRARKKAERDDNELLPGPVYSTVESVDGFTSSTFGFVPAVETAMDVHLPEKSEELVERELIAARARIVELEQEIELLRTKTRAPKRSPAKEDFDFNDWMKELHPQDREYFEQRLGKRSK